MAVTELFRKEEGKLTLQFIMTMSTQVDGNRDAFGWLYSPAHWSVEGWSRESLVSSHIVKSSRRIHMFVC